MPLAVWEVPPHSSLSYGQKVKQYEQNKSYVHESNKRKSITVTEEVKHSQTTSNFVENHSEAGPDVAEFSEEELRKVAELFKDTPTFDFFQKASNSKLLCESPLGRLSSFVKRDFLYKASFEGNQEKGQDSGLDISGDSVSLTAACGNDDGYQHFAMTSDSPVSAFESSNRITSSMKPESKLFSEEEFTQALKMQELLLHEKQAKKDKERNDYLKSLEKERQMLKNQVSALSKNCRASRGVLEELLNIFSHWGNVKDQEKLEVGNSSKKALKERDQALEDLQNVESAFADLHRRYENCKSVLEGYKQNEEKLKQQIADVNSKLKQQEQMYEMLRSRIQDKLDSANAEIESAKKSGDAEVTVLRAQLKKAEMKITSLEKDLEQKKNENAELSSICDDLIAKVGKA